ncbi:hypothetical protein Q6348_01915 [Isoptericola sp. b441]|uniref:Secreted protein n=1 Tax=Actinotalea lenta TaxID=3064654 RepID=A0ABT9D5A6_9CELL|nr:hypothetical protein [Isoptericola sp. b441]MDO8105949.1 hypothetical protein [Isoptericola sp. b441]
MPGILGGGQGVLIKWFRLLLVGTGCVSGQEISDRVWAVLQSSKPAGGAAVDRSPSGGGGHGLEVPDRRAEWFGKWNSINKRFTLRSACRAARRPCTLDG